MARGVPPVVGLMVASDNGDTEGLKDAVGGRVGDATGALDGAFEGEMVVAWEVGMGDGGETIGALVGALEVVGSGEGGETIGALVGALEVVGSGDGGETIGALVGALEVVGSGEGGETIGALVGALEVVGTVVICAVGTGVGFNVGVPSMLTIATKPVDVTLLSD